MALPNELRNSAVRTQLFPNPTGSFAPSAGTSGRRSLQIHPDGEGGHLLFIPAESAEDSARYSDLMMKDIQQRSRSLCCGGNLTGSLNDMTEKKEIKMERNEKAYADNSHKVAENWGSTEGPKEVRPNTSSNFAAAMCLVEADKAHRSLQADQVLMMRMVMPMLSSGLRQLQQGINRWMNHQGFWSRSGQSEEAARWQKGEKIALIHSEVSELLEGVREDKGIRNEGEECADIVIRVLDYCEQYDIDIATYIEDKMYKNYQRLFRHGKVF